MTGPGALSCTPELLGPDCTEETGGQNFSSPPLPINPTSLERTFMIYVEECPIKDGKADAGLKQAPKGALVS